MNSLRTRGFTLVELLVTISIVAILAGLAYPSYTSYVRKGKRAEARAAISDLLQQQERYLTQRNTYVAFAAGDSTVPFKTYSGENRTYTAHLIGAEVCDAATSIQDCVQVVAVPQQADPEAGTLKLTSTGVKSCTGTTPALCWK